MMNSRRNFLRNSILITGFAGLSPLFTKAGKTGNNWKKKKKIKKPVVISTWNHGLAANEKAWSILTNNGPAIDAVEQGVMISEADPEVSSVGYGGLPDRDGNVTLDACIMDDQGECGAVAFLKNIKHPISVARLVKDRTPHIMLAGEGAQEFALSNGFRKENLLTEKAKKRWQEWMRSQNFHPIPDEDHDTIGMLALDKEGNLSGACTTSGLAWKYHGRVGDSPIIGAGLFVDNEVGAATATGKGEAVIKIAGTHLIVELMRNGRSPQEACEEAIDRIMKKNKALDTFQVGFLALDKYGNTGAYSLNRGFEYALFENDQNELIGSDYALKK